MDVIPVEIIDHILTRCLGWRSRFCVRSVCRLWFHAASTKVAVFKATPAQYFAAKRYETRWGMTVEQVLESGRLVFASEVARHIAALPRDTDPIDAERWCRSLGASTADTVVVLVASGVGAFIDHVTGPDNAYISHDPHNPDIIDAVIRTRSVATVTRYLDSNPMVVVKRSCAALSGMFHPRKGTHVRRAHVYDRKVEGTWRPSDRVSRFLYSVIDHFGKPPPPPRQGTRWSDVASEATASDALTYLHIALCGSRSLAGVSRADNDIAEFGPWVEPHHVAYTVVASMNASWGRCAETLAWLYQESRLMAPLRPITVLDRTNFAFAHHGTVLPDQNRLALIEYVCEAYPASVAVIASLFEAIFVHARTRAMDLEPSYRDGGGVPYEEDEIAIALDRAVMAVARFDGTIDVAILARIDLADLLPVEGARAWHDEVVHCRFTRAIRTCQGRESWASGAWRSLLTAIVARQSLALPASPI